MSKSLVISVSTILTSIFLLLIATVNLLSPVTATVQPPIVDESSEEVIRTEPVIELIMEDTPTTHYSPTPALVKTNLDENLYINEVNVFNKYLYELCNKYFNVSTPIGRVSPLYPMAIANVETPGRADVSKTFSSLFPSKYVPLNSTKDIDNLTSGTLLTDANIFTGLATDWQTRDRGPLQVQAGFGSASVENNALMGPSELSNINASLSVLGNSPTWTAHETKANGGVITVDTWINGASNYQGDRYNPKDLALKMDTACELALDQITAQYPVTSEDMVVMMLSVFHGASSVWNPAYADTDIGNWRSGKHAYSYLQKLEECGLVNAVKERAHQDLESNSVPNLTLTGAVIENIMTESGCNINPHDYVKDTRYDWVTYTYPLRAIYSMEVLKILYGGVYA